MEGTKRYILDTNVLLHDPGALLNFKENEIYLPLEVIVELDKFKRGSDEKNVHARQAIREIERLTVDGITEEGVELPSEGRLFFLQTVQKETDYQNDFQSNVIRMIEDGKRIIESKLGYADDRILDKAKDLAEKEPQATTCIVSKDINLRIRARAMGLLAADYLHDKAAIDLHAFFKQDPEFFVAKELIDEIFSQKKSDVTKLPQEYQESLQHNQYLILKYDSTSALVKHRNGTLIRLPERRAIEGIKPRNYSQRFLFDACLDPQTTIVSALGKAGTGKTLLALAAGIHQVIERADKRYEKIIVFRPILETGRELGYLPGEVEDKIGPYFAPIETALEVIGDDAMRSYSNRGEFIEYKPINYVRGDTFHDSFIIVDEAQNYTRKELKLIGSRMGVNSKIVMIGDPFQIDNPYLDEKSNALTVITDRFRHEINEFAYVILDKVERSREAEIFADYL